MDGTDDILIPAGTSWLNDPDAQRVCAAISKGGFDVYFVGGCVRNALLGLPDSDVDMSTNATPSVIMALAAGAELKAIPTGIDHGTVTIVAGDKPFEVTTFRKDVETDGRRAVVAFSDDIIDDARRRDFTMNALYATGEGRVIDPLGGLDDLRARRIRFIEDPAARIREDYLRILRFFRFSAWYADPSEGFDPDAIAAIAANISGLETLSAERLGQEMTKLLAAPDPARAVAVMQRTGALSAILPGTHDRWLGVLIHLEGAAEAPPRWTARLAILGGEDTAQRLRLSKAEAKEVALLKDAAFSAMDLAEFAYRQDATLATQAFLLRAAMAETTPDFVEIERFEAAAKAIFPVKAQDLMPQFQGPALGARLRVLEEAWITSGFALRREELLDLP